MPSTPGHHIDLTMVGDIEGFYHAPNGRILGLLVHVDIGEANLIPVIPTTGMGGFHKGDRVWLRGALKSQKVDGNRYALLFVEPRHFEVISHRGGSR